MGIDKGTLEKAKEQVVNEMLKRYFKDYDDQTKIAIKQFFEASMLGERNVNRRMSREDRKEFKKSRNR
ncbi:MAG TPA: hypothetical protein ENG58_04400 [Thermotogales bacterium]|nr:hypothetical protein [Thermotogales bacterium]